MKKIIALVLALTMLCGLMVTAHADDKIKIGISIWSSTDTLGSEVKRLIDAAADALGVETAWVDQGHISEQVTASAEQLAMADKDISFLNAAVTGTDGFYLGTEKFYAGFQLLLHKIIVKGLFIICYELFSLVLFRWHFLFPSSLIYIFLMEQMII